MNKIKTKYGVFDVVSSVEMYNDGGVKECTFYNENKICTDYGVLIPQYSDGGLRRKFTKSVAFHNNGNIKSISLHEQTPIQTSIGVIAAELVTFYESGRLKRIFPLNGKISGYWTEENEYELATDIEFKFKFGSFKKKVIGIQFYENGAIKSITFWPKDLVPVQSPIGDIEVRIGIALYPDGSIKSLEPKRPTVLNTPVGDIIAYDPNAIGVHGDNNSIGFYEDGSIKCLSTPTDEIIAEEHDGRSYKYAPALVGSMLDPEKMSIVPLKIGFIDGKVQFNNCDQDSYEISKCNFVITHLPEMFKANCGDCSSCSVCG